MPTSKEVVQQRPLAGHELADIITRDVQDMLRRDGMFHAHMAYRRVAYRIELKLMVDNPMFPEHKTFRESRNPPRNIRPGDPKNGHLLNLEAPPLVNPSPDAVVVGVAVEKNITSPNQARLNSGIPIVSQSLNKATGHVRDREIKYDASQVPVIPVQTSDTTEALRLDWGAGIPAGEAGPDAPVAPPPTPTPTPADPPVQQPVKGGKAR